MIYINTTTSSATTVAWWQASCYLDGQGTDARFSNIMKGISLTPDNTAQFLMDDKYMCSVDMRTYTVSTVYTNPVTAATTGMITWKPCLACTVCSPGQYVSCSCSSSGSTITCTTCATGYYSDTTTSTSCSLCTNNPGVYGIFKGPTALSPATPART